MSSVLAALAARCLFSAQALNRAMPSFLFTAQFTTKGSQIHIAASRISSGNFTPVEPQQAPSSSALAEREPTTPLSSQATPSSTESSSITYTQQEETTGGRYANLAPTDAHDSGLGRPLRAAHRVLLRS